MSTLTGTTSLGARLDAEWRRRATSPAASAALASWRRAEPILIGYQDFEAVRQQVHDRDNPERSDHVLAALVRLAAVTGHDDTAAAWLVLNLLKPGAIHLAVRLAPLVGELASSEALVFAELTIRVREYPWQRRPRRVAANLLLDCRQRILRDQQRHRLELPVDLIELTADAVDERSTPVAADLLDDRLAVHHLLWLARRRRILTKDEAALLAAVYLDDTPIDQLTGVFGQSRSTLYTIRAAAERRLRDAFGDLEPTRTPSAPVDRDRVVAAYLAGGSVARLARRYATSTGQVAVLLREAGVQLRGSTKKKPIDIDQLAKRYHAGESATSLAAWHGTSIKTIARRLHEAGIEPRTPAEANRLRASPATSAPKPSEDSNPPEAGNGSHAIAAERARAENPQTTTDSRREDRPRPPHADADSRPAGPSPAPTAPVSANHSRSDQQPTQTWYRSRQ